MGIYFTPTLTTLLTIKDDIVGVHHWEQTPEGQIHIPGGPRPEEHRAGLCERSVVVSAHLPFLVVPRQTQLVGQDRCRDGGAVVAAPADQHDTQAWNLAFCAEFVLGFFGRRFDFAGVAFYGRRVVSVGGVDVISAVRHVGAVDFELGHFCSFFGGNVEVYLELLKNNCILYKIFSNTMMNVKTLQMTRWHVNVRPTMRC